MMAYIQFTEGYERWVDTVTGCESQLVIRANRLLG